ncbi:MAG: hypothetical protein MUF00_06940 [Gemmatimonadaceae bacterium]|jgi:outer membrane lipoprotein-sorting protein|nr:hypothetical protein [Gemmatimonadaceae bacterium]
MRVSSRASRALFLATSLVAASAAHAQTPTADQIIAKYVDAIGGKSAIVALSSMRQTGTMEMPAMGMSMEMEVAAATPNKRVTKMVIPGMGEMMQGYDGKTAWAMDPMQGPRVLKDKELTQLMEQADFSSEMLKSASNFKAIEVQGQEAFEGQQAWKVKFTRPSGNVTTEFFAVDSGLLLGSVTTQSSPMGELEARSVLSDYKAYGPVKLPGKIAITAGPQQMTMTTKSVTFNDVPDTAFALPEAIKALVKP